MVFMFRDPGVQISGGIKKENTVRNSGNEKKAFDFRGVQIVGDKCIKK